MYKGILNKDTTVNASANIPFSTVINSNANTTPSSVNNSVAINATGYYNITTNLVVTDVTATIVSAYIMADSEVIGAATSDITTGTGTISLAINDVERVSIAPASQKVNISVQLDANATIGEGSKLIIEKVR